MSSKYIHILLFSLLAITGCTALGEKYTPAPQPPEKKALVYLFRTNISLGGGWRTSFFVNHKEVAVLQNGGYTWVHLDARNNVFEAKSLGHDDLVLHKPLEAGKTYYIEVSQDPIGNNIYRNWLRMLPPEQGKYIVGSYRYKKANQ